MRLDGGILEEIMGRARLSAREREAMRLECSGERRDEELAELMGCSVASVRTYRHRGRRKLAAAQAAWAAEQAGRDQEEVDAEEVGTGAGFYRFLLQAIRPPRQADHGPNIGLTWREYDPQLGLERTLALEGAAHAGPLVTVGDLLGWETPRMPARENRERLQGMEP
jgi:DNA-binding CsgD family transcriptional regulator